MPRLHPRRIALLGDFHRGMAEKHGHLVDRNAGEEKLHGEGVTEAVGMRAAHIRYVDAKFAERSLLIGNRRFGEAVAGPEEVARMHVRRLVEGRDDVRWQRHEDRHAGLLHIEEKLAVADALTPERGGVADTEPGVRRSSTIARRRVRFPSP